MEGTLFPSQYWHSVHTQTNTRTHRPKQPSGASKEDVTGSASPSLPVLYVNWEPAWGERENLQARPGASLGLIKCNIYISRSGWNPRDGWKLEEETNKCLHEELPCSLTPPPPGTFFQNTFPYLVFWWWRWRHTAPTSPRGWHLVGVKAKAYDSCCFLSWDSLWIHVYLDYSGFLFICCLAICLRESQSAVIFSPRVQLRTLRTYFLFFRTYPHHSSFKPNLRDAYQKRLLLVYLL